MARSRVRKLKTILYETSGPVARIVMNTPEKANIQTAQQVWDFDQALSWADRDESIKVLILKANGRGFCAGHAIVSPDELAEVYPTTGKTPEATHKNHNQDLFLWPPLRLWEFPKATIAQIHGYCLGGGTVYGFLPDLSIASDDAYFQMPLPQGFGLPGAQTLIEPWVLMSWKKAFEYLYLGPTLSAAQAREWGFINEVVPRDRLEARVEEVAASIARMPLSTIMAIKTSVKRMWEMMGMRVHLQTTTDYITLCSGATDVREHMAKGGARRPRKFAADQASDAQTAPAGQPSAPSAKTVKQPATRPKPSTLPKASSPAARSKPSKPPRPPKRAARSKAAGRSTPARPR